MSRLPPEAFPLFITSRSGHVADRQTAIVHGVAGKSAARSPARSRGRARAFPAGRTLAGVRQVATTSSTGGAAEAAEDDARGMDHD